MKLVKRSAIFAALVIIALGLVMSGCVKKTADTVTTEEYRTVLTTEPASEPASELASEAASLRIPTLARQTTTKATTTKATTTKTATTKAATTTTKAATTKATTTKAATRPATAAPTTRPVTAAPTTRPTTAAPTTRPTTAAPTTRKQVSADSIAQALMDSDVFSGEIIKGGNTKKITREVGLEDISYSEMVYCPGVNSEMILVLKVGSREDASAVAEKMKAYCKDTADMYASYNPVETAKLNSAVIFNNGEYVILCVSADNAKAETLIEKMF